MLRAAILARNPRTTTTRTRTTSPSRQVERGRAYIAAKGWSLDDVHLYGTRCQRRRIQNRPGCCGCSTTSGDRRHRDVGFSVSAASSHTGTVLAQIHGAGARSFYLTDENCVTSRRFINPWSA